MWQPRLQKPENLHEGSANPVAKLYPQHVKGEPQPTAVPVHTKTLKLRSDVLLAMKKNQRMSLFLLKETLFIKERKKKAFENRPE